MRVLTPSSADYVYRSTDAGSHQRIYSMLIESTYEILLEGLAAVRLQKLGLTARPSTTLS